MFNNFLKSLKNFSAGNNIVLTLITIAIILSLITYYTLTKESRILGPNPNQVIGWVLADLAIFLSLGILFARKYIGIFFDKKKGHKSSKLQKRIIIAFSIVATLPTIIVSVFSAYFFNFGIQVWFDKKLSTTLDQSIIVAESYLAEHTIQLKNTARSIADDLSEMYYDLIHDHNLFIKSLNGEAEMRGLDEAIVFQRSTNTIIAQTPLSFSISFTTLPMHVIEKADKGDIVEIKSDPTKIKMLIKLNEYNDTYLLIGRLIDNKIIDHIDKTNGAAAEYYRLKKSISSMQVRFSIVFILVALVLLLAAISWGAIFAGQIVSPIRKLVIATEKVKDGDLTVQVPEENLIKDEIRILSSAFNRMIKQINRQQKELVIAQRALAWSDVARRVAHEIKNPLTPIQLSAERLHKKFENEISDKEGFYKYIQTIIRHTNDIKRIVSEFVNFARLPTPIFAKCEIIRLIKEIIESRRLINDRITYIFIVNEPEMELVCDLSQINQIMINLIKNAEEALEEVENSPIIKISLNKMQELISIQVQDNGPGFPNDLIDKATEAYVTKRAKGMGLGLAIVKKIVQDHLGSIEIFNQKNGGAIIKLTFNAQELKFKLK